ncbi:hypothetical protein [Burkholderia sp. PU8-34]
MKERPILFSGPMVRAILEGRKTQTRRVLKRQPPAIGEGYAPKVYWPTRDSHMSNRGDRAYLQFERPGEYDGRHIMKDGFGFDCPFGQPGDRLWVRETTYDVERNGWIGPVYVESDDGAAAAAWGWGESDDPDYIEPYELRKRPAIHMPRSMARITLEITGVRVERLQDISEDDAIAEGIDGPMCAAAVGRSPSRHKLLPAAVHGYAHLWGGLNAARGYGWDANPWVWVVEFKRINGEM